MLVTLEEKLRFWFRTCLGRSGILGMSGCLKVSRTCLLEGIWPWERGGSRMVVLCIKGLVSPTMPRIPR